MNCKTSLGRFAAIAAAGIGLVFAHAAAAQTIAADDKPPVEDKSAPADTADADEADDIMKDVDVSKLDWSQLSTDNLQIPGKPVSKARTAASGAAGSDLSWSNNDKANGASDVSVKQSVSPFLDTRVGADMTVARQPTTMSELLSEKASNGGSQPQSSGTAWAAITGPGAGAIWDKTSVEARVDPGQEQSKLGTTISKSVPLNDQNSLTLQSGYNMTQQGMVPVPGLATEPTRNYQTDQSAKVSFGDTGTSITAGQSLSSGDDKWQRKVGAEQKLLDGVTVSGSVGETAQGTVTKSISAGFKRSW